MQISAKEKVEPKKKGPAEGEEAGEDGEEGLGLILVLVLWLGIRLL